MTVDDLGRLLLYGDQFNKLNIPANYNITINIASEFSEIEDLEIITNDKNKSVLITDHKVG